MAISHLLLYTQNDDDSLPDNFKTSLGKNLICLANILLDRSEED